MGWLEGSTGRKDNDSMVHVTCGILNFGASSGQLRRQIEKGLEGKTHMVFANMFGIFIVRGGTFYTQKP
jgi:hypothetical protein